MPRVPRFAQATDKLRYNPFKPRGEGEITMPNKSKNEAAIQGRGSALFVGIGCVCRARLKNHRDRCPLHGTLFIVRQGGEGEGMYTRTHAHTRTHDRQAGTHYVARARGNGCAGG